MKKTEQLEKILNEEFYFSWECPCCAATFESDGVMTKGEFAEYLYNKGIRFKIMKYMQGVFCKDCYTDPETQNSTL